MGATSNLAGGGGFGFVGPQAANQALTLPGSTSALNAVYALNAPSNGVYGAYVQIMAPISVDIVIPGLFVYGNANVTSTQNVQIQMSQGAAGAEVVRALAERQNFNASDPMWVPFALPVMFSVGSRIAARALQGNTGSGLTVYIAVPYTELQDVV